MNSTVLVILYACRSSRSIKIYLSKKTNEQFYIINKIALIKPSTRW